MAEDTKMEPCPFCRSEAKMLGASTGHYWVKCQACGAEGPVRKSEFAARADWNKRAARPSTDPAGRGTWLQDQLYAAGNDTSLPVRIRALLKEAAYRIEQDFEEPFLLTDEEAAEMAKADAASAEEIEEVREALGIGEA